LNEIWFVRPTDFQGIKIVQQFQLQI